MDYDAHHVPTVTSFKSIDLIQGHVYQFSVRAIMRVGKGRLSPFSFLIKAAQAPGRLAALLYLSSTATTITMQFSDDLDNGGLLVTHLPALCRQWCAFINEFYLSHNLLWRCSHLYN